MHALGTHMRTRTHACTHTCVRRWHGTTTHALLGALRLFDPTSTGYADWREVVTCLIGAAFPIVPQASCADVADQCEVRAAVCFILS